MAAYAYTRVKHSSPPLMTAIGDAAIKVGKCNLDPLSRPVACCLPCPFWCMCRCKKIQQVFKGTCCKYGVQQVNVVCLGPMPLMGAHALSVAVCVCVCVCVCACVCAPQHMSTCKLLSAWDPCRSWPLML